MNTELRRILTTYGRLSVPAEGLADDDDLFAVGLDSLAIVNVMLALEEAFDIELPDNMLNRRTFASIHALEAAVASLKGHVAAENVAKENVT